MTMFVLAVLAAMLVAVGQPGIVQIGVGMIRAVRMLMGMGMLVGMSVAVRMGVHRISVPVFVSMHVGVGVFVLMLVRMRAGLAVRVPVIAWHVLSP